MTTTIIQEHEKHPIKIFYHIYAVKDRWLTIVQDQMTKLLYSGLLHKCEACFITIVGPDYNACRAYVTQFPNVFIKVSSADTTMERLTLLNIHQHIKPEDYVLYIHSKGVTKYDIDIVRDWRHLMEWCLIGNHAKCIALLEKHDAVGINRIQEPRPHFSGNFWWTKGSHYLKLPHHIGPEYTDPEMYLLSVDCWTYSLFESGMNHYTVPYPMKQYLMEELPSRGGAIERSIAHKTW